MKRLLVLAAAFMLSLHASAQWKTIDIGTTADVVNVHFTGPLKGFIILRDESTSRSLLLSTLDGGETWKEEFVHSYLSGMDFLDNDTGAIIGYDTVFTTYDGGSNWNIIPTQMQDPVMLFKMLDAEEWLYVRGQKHGHTYDGGKTWTEISLGSSGPLPIVTTDLQFISKDTIVGIGWYGNRTFMSPDRGNNWQLLSDQIPMGAMALYSICLPTSKIAFAGSKAGILKSTDGAVNWIMSYTGQTINCVRYVNENILYAVGDSGVVLKTTDGGTNWVQETSGTSTKLNKIYILPGKAIIIGDSGTVLINNSIPTYVSQSRGELLVNIFPVPVSSILTVEIVSQAFTGGRMEVFDVTGKKVGVFILSERINEVNVSGFQEGVYFYNISSEKGTIMRGQFVKL